MNIKNMSATELLNQLQQLQQPEKKVSILDLCNEYHTLKKIEGRVDETMRVMRIFLDRFVSWCTVNSKKDISDITKKDTQDYYEFLNTVCAEGSSKIQYTYLKAVFNHAVRNEYIFRNPFTLRFPPVLKVHDKYWTPKYFEQLIKAIRKYGKPKTREKTELIVRLIFTTGLRIGKLTATQESDIKIFDEETIMITTTRKTRSASQVKTHVTYLKNAKAIEMLKAHIENCKDVPLWSKTEPWDTRKILMRICKKADIEYMSPQKAKHGFITLLAEKGISAEMICELTGNTNVELVRKTYSHFNKRPSQTGPHTF